MNSASLFRGLQCLLVVLFFTTTACEHFNKRKTPQDGSKPHIIQPTDDAPTTHGSSSDVVNVPDFVAVKAPRVGLIFGPGGAKVLAHIGVLQELERQKIPVVAAVGLEWGSLIGALYSLNGKSHEVDWQMSNLPKVNFSSANLFSKKMQATTTEVYSKYFNQIFAASRVESTKLPFACTYVKSETATAAMVTKGAIKSVIKSCWQYPPLFSVTESKAAPYAVGDAVSYLKKNGAEIVVIINVLDSPSQKDFTNWSDASWVWFSWVPVHAAIRSAQFSGVNETITIDTSAFTMTDFDQRLRLIQVGKQGAASQIDQLIKKYDF